MKDGAFTQLAPKSKPSPAKAVSSPELLTVKLCQTASLPNFRVRRSLEGPDWEHGGKPARF